MIGIIKSIFKLVVDMSPYLMFGFLLAGVLYVLLPKERVTKTLGKKKFSSVVKAALLGIPLPLCSCGVIPTGISIYKQGSSKGAAISFLISTPQTGVDSIIVTYSFLGPVFAFFRVIFAFVSGLFGGAIVNKISKNDNKEKEHDIIGASNNEVTKHVSFWKKIRIALNYGFIDLFSKLSTYLFVGFIIAGLIMYFIPNNFLQNIGTGITGMLVMLLLGIPMYICSTASIPIAIALIAKGVSPGAAFVFLIAGPATNAVSLTVIAKTFGKKIAGVFVSSIIVFALIAGFLLDLTLKVFPMSFNLSHGSHSAFLPKWLTIVTAIVFITLLMFALIKKYYLKLKMFRNKSVSTSCCTDGTCGLNSYKGDNMSEKIVLSIEGMTCDHCKMHATKALEKVDGVTEVNVSLENKNAIVAGKKLDKGKLVIAVEQAGYSAKVM